MENPFAEGENRIIRPPGTAIVIFGATGDLTHRKLIPALYNLAYDDYMPSNFVVVGAARTPLSDEDFRKNLFESVKKHSRRTINDELWQRFSQNIYYQQLDGTSLESFVKLRERLQSLEKKRAETLNYLYYLATSPSFFGPIATNLRGAGLVEDPKAAARSTSLIIEKPFGHDLASARELNSVLRKSFAEEQIFRIDHYLGKETVQNILVFRFANGIFEPLWNHNFIDHIQISFCEDIGVGSRAGYFDQSGILRDIVQNHLLQILALLCIEPPYSLSDADAIRDEKVKVLRAIRRLKPEDVARQTVRAQYTKGFVNGESAIGYMEEKGIAATSQTETFAALRLEVDNWRWSGVPIYVRAGKRLAKRITEISIAFKRAPESLFRGRQVGELDQNILAIQVQPNEGISLKICSKPPGPRLRVRPVVMDFTYGHSFGVPSPDAYERLLLDSMKGDASLFTRDDEIEEAWDLLAPVLEQWALPAGGKVARPPLHTYEAGTWGPAAAATLLKEQKHRWRRL
ncbi:MAG: glucose-6-phosphate dehydrogenase [Oligoflexia bacterium]|nr:glucose-6-phosphate dehydrogenase [Oligoflexia bacterium]